ncbi:PEP-CTERM sorting domain-containing protein [bacterium]|nr:MAG: PEP-CTERM sorting domain-containing protein [bacterium]
MFSKTLAIVALAGVALTSAQAAFVYGLSTGTDSGIFKIDVTTGNTTLVHNLAHAGTLNNGTTNGLARDAATGDFYYRSTDKKLYRVNGSGETLVGTLSGAASAATFYNGSYYYIAEGSNKVRRVNVASFSDTLFGTPSGLVASSYGDIAAKTNGEFYGASSHGFYQASLTSISSPAVYKSSNTGNLQLGLYNNTSLYGIDTSADKVYSINASTGVKTLTSTLTNGSRLFITDAAAAQAVPEPASMIALGLGAAAMIRRRRKA